MGCTADELSRRMTLREMTERAVVGPVWTRRLEMLLAQVAMVIARCNGNDVSLADMDLFAKPAEQPEMSSGDGAAALGVIAGGVGVRVLGSKRKAKLKAKGIAK